MHMKRVWASLPDKVYEDLERWAQEEGRNQSNLIAALLEIAVKTKQGERVYLTQPKPSEPLHT